MKTPKMTTTTNSPANAASATKTMTTPLFATNYHVYINHTDAGGIVYHANHLVFFENCRRDWFTELGLNGYFLQTTDGQVQHFVVSEAQLNYHQAIFLDEVISVRIDKVELKPASIVFYQSIHRILAENKSVDKSKSTNTLLSSTKIVIACVQNQINPTPSVQPSNQDSVAPTVVASAAPIRLIRVPQDLHDSIQQAITHHASEQ
ncbi:acyl-CoA thioester hydrolase [Psychrobacter sp. PL19]|uniref:hotdog domain-containing protein n=1 Tax=Psychrobacter sp. PL19 TaxID=2760711 RepID=UPI001AE113A4